jgi:hypothetical protein
MQKRKLELDKELLTTDSNRLLDGGTNMTICFQTLNCITAFCPPTAETCGCPTQTCGDTCGCVGSEGCTYPSVENIPGTCDGSD